MQFKLDRGIFLCRVFRRGGGHLGPRIFLHFQRLSPAIQVRDVGHIGTVCGSSVHIKETPK